MSCQQVAPKCNYPPMALITTCGRISHKAKATASQHQVLHNTEKTSRAVELPVPRLLLSLRGPSATQTLPITLSSRRKVKDKSSGRTLPSNPRRPRLVADVRHSGSGLPVAFQRFWLALAIIGREMRSWRAVWKWKVQISARIDFTGLRWLKATTELTIPDSERAKIITEEIPDLSTKPEENKAAIVCHLRPSGGHTVNKFEFHRITHGCFLSCLMLHTFSMFCLLAMLDELGCFVWRHLLNTI